MRPVCLKSAYQGGAPVSWFSPVISSTASQPRREQQQVDPGLLDVGDTAWNNFCVTDVDECATDSHQCNPTQICINTEGGYTCSCTDGYWLLEGQCLGKGSPLLPGTQGGLMVVRDTIQCGYNREIQVSFSLGVYRKPLNNGTCVTIH